MRLIVFLLKCLVGFLASVGVLALLLVGGLAYLFTQFQGHFEDWTSQEELPSQMVLMLDTAGGMTYGPSGPNLLLSGLGRSPSLIDVMDSLEAAADDPAVKGLVVRLGYGELSAAESQELRSLVSDFQESGKFAIGFAESFGEAGNGTLHYSLATGLDEIWLQPSGSLDLLGFQLETPFFAQLLDDWDIRVRFDQREEYKGLADAMVREDMSPAVRSNLQDLLDSWFSQVAAAIAEGRGISEGRARQLMNQGPYSARDALEAGLVDHLGYWDELLERLPSNGSTSEAANEHASDLVPLADYHSQLESTPKDDSSSIALIYVNGSISLGKAEGGALSAAGTGADRISDAIANAAASEEVKAIILRVESPGGSYVASDTIWREVIKAQQNGLPVIVSMASVAASGGYFIAAPADRILALPGSITGSIGVAGGKLVLSGLWDRLGVNWDGAQAGRNADIWSMNSDFDEEQWQWFQDSLDRVYDDFTGKVAQARGLTEDEIEAAAGGRIWSGADALRVGLVDELGGLRQAIEAASEVADLPSDKPIRLTPYPDPDKELQDWVRRSLSGGIESPEALARLERILILGERLAPFMERIEQLFHDPRSGLLQDSTLTRQ